MLDKDRVEKYKDFTDPSGKGDSYNPRKGIERLMSTISPDPKGIVLAGMGPGVHFTSWGLYSEVLNWMEGINLARDFPVTFAGVWTYLERKNQNRQLVDGSLVEIGAVVKQTHLYTDSGYQTGYTRSGGGAELALPLVQQTMKFVEQSKKLNPSPRYRSPGRIIGNIASSFENRRVLVIFDALEFLVNNPGFQRPVDIKMGSDTAKQTLGRALEELDICGIIDYNSTPEIRGKAQKRYNGFKISEGQDPKNIDPNSVYEQIQESVGRNFHRRGDLYRVLEYMHDHPNAEYNRHKIEGELKIPAIRVGRVLSNLHLIGVIQSPEGAVMGNRKQALAKANQATRLFYDMVLLPIKEVATTLTPLPLNPWRADKVSAYLSNYQDERKQLGPNSGGDTRDVVYSILAQNSDEMKLSDIIDQYNEKSKRFMRKGIGRHLNNLIQEGKVKKTKPGFYQAVDQDLDCSSQ